ncbi:hypothetical protein J2Y63_007017 [Shinella sp. BE166]|uniref:hypothetical protein n=1 Tax=Shinella sp. BE166 TaxID=3373918 RepID=UPI003EB7E2B5
MVNINADKILEALDQDCFIPSARRMVFHREKAEKLAYNIRHFSVNNANIGDALLVLWRLPYYVLLYEGRCIENGADPQEYRDVVVAVNNAVEEKINDIAAILALVDKGSP